MLHLYHLSLAFINSIAEHVLINTFGWNDGCAIVDRRFTLIVRAD